MNEVSDLLAEIHSWASQEPDLAVREDLAQLSQKVTAGDRGAQEIAFETFGRRLSFGTAGLRGPIRPGPNGMNRIVVCQTSAGLARYLRSARTTQQASSPTIIIGYDGRHGSKIFARDAAEVFSGNGFRALLFPRALPTPLLAFAVIKLGADAGVMVTASHNPATDNGYKVYLGGADRGSQVTAPADREIEKCILEVAKDMQFSDIPRSQDNVEVLGAEIIEDYFGDTLASLRLTRPTNIPMTTVYTAMHGVGGKTFLAAMDKAGFPKPHVVEEQFDPNPDFPTVSFPNPEERGALDLSFAKACSVQADLIIAHDPDADRLSVALPDSSTSVGYRSLTGNQVGAVFGWNIGEKARVSGRTGTLANSLVSSPVLGKIAHHFGLQHEETLTGFKYVSRVPNLMFGFEEALGYLVTPDVVRDKDGISAGLLMLSLCHTLASEGRTLWDYLHEIEESVGAFASGQVTIRLNPGDAASNVTSSLREKKLSRIGSLPVTRQDDFLEGVGNFPKVDILRYYLGNGCRVIARPSGTEPKIKFYIDTEGASSDEAHESLKEVESALYLLLRSHFAGPKPLAWTSSL